MFVAQGGVSPRKFQPFPVSGEPQTDGMFRYIALLGLGLLWRRAFTTGLTPCARHISPLWGFLDTFFKLVL